MNPDADTTRIVRAEQFLRFVELLTERGVDQDSAEVLVGMQHPHLACAFEQLQHPPELWPEVLECWSIDEE